jgi:hypothetical protein
VAAGPWPVSRWLLILALILFILAALASGGVISASLAWLVPAGLAALTAAFLVP